MRIPEHKPQNNKFSSGPCRKFPKWTADAVDGRALLGRSHRCQRGMEQIRRVLDKTRQLLQLPDEYLVGIVPGSNTGAVEMAMWNLLGPRPVDVLVWEHFGSEWATDVRDELQLDDHRVLTAPFGEIVDLGTVRPEADVVFTWNGTTSGVRVPNADWIADDRAGVTISDATSGIFAQELDWSKLDVTTYSWQKVLGGEAGHGVIVLSPRAVERLVSGEVTRGLPKCFRLARDGKLFDGIFKGATINTVSMWCVADCELVLDWALEIGGAEALRARADANFAVVQNWIDQSSWAKNLVSDPAIRSNTSVCIAVDLPWFKELPEAEQYKWIKQVESRLEAEGAACDVANHRAAPPSFRVWCGSTVEAEDLDALTAWLDWGVDALARQRG